MKKVLSVMLAAAMLASMAAGCQSSSGAASVAGTASEGSDTASTAAAGTANSGKKIKVGSTVYYYTEFITLMAKGMKREAAQEGVDLTILDANNDAQKQLSQVENLIAQKVDVIVVAAVDTDAIVPAVAMCKKANIPLVAVNMLINTKEPYYYVGPNDVQAGEEEMQACIDAMGGKGNIVILQGPIGTSAQLQRSEGNHNVLKKYPDVKVLAEQPANWDRSQALTLTENWLQAFPDKIGGIVAHNDEMAMGALKAIQAKGLKTPITGVDAIKDGCLSIKNQTPFIATVYQNADMEGSLGVKTAIQIARGQKPEKEKNYIDMELMTKDNVSKLLTTIYQ